MSDSKENKSGASDSAGKQKPPPTLFSWAIRGISLLIILGLVGYFVAAALQPQEPPVFKFTVKNEKIEQRGTGWAVPVDVVNNGTMSVHALKVKATLTDHPDQPEESADIVLMGPGETVTATFWFGEDPRGLGLELEVGAYLLP